MKCFRGQLKGDLQEKVAAVCRLDFDQDVKADDEEVHAPQTLAPSSRLRHNRRPDEGSGVLGRARQTKNEMLVTCIAQVNVRDMDSVNMEVLHG